MSKHDGSPRSALFSLVPLLSATLLLVTACGLSSSNEDSAFDPELVQEKQRRIAAFDSVVRSVNTDSAYRLWHWTLTAPDAKVGQQKVECEYDRILFANGRAGSMAIARMEDTVFRHVDPELVHRMKVNLKGMSLPSDESVCGPPPSKRAPYWLREWTVYPLPQLPPSATDSAPRRY